MKKLPIFLLTCGVIYAFARLFAACNPQCDPFGKIEISSNNNPAGYQILIRATPASILQGKTISFGNTVVTDSFKRYVPDVGLIVTVPQGISGSTQLKIEDPDCSDVVALDFTVNSVGFYSKNGNFVAPILPDIIIPSFVNFYPLSINNAWVSPVNTDYCLWFKVDTVQVVNKATKDTIITYPLSAGNSFEKSSCGGIANDPNKIYATNLIYGYYDATSKPRKLNFFVDRTKKGLGVEEYIGEFIDIKATNYNRTGFPAIGNCGRPIANVVGDMLLVTSRTTGRQTVVYNSSVGP